MTRLEDQKKARLDKLTQIMRAKKNPYPATTKRTHRAKDVISRFDQLVKEDEKITLSGRITSMRLHGGSSFFHIDDGSEKIQIYFKKDLLGKDQYNFLKENIDLGDFIEAQGKLFQTKKGEKTLEVEKYKLLAKSLLPLPEKWHGLSDVEIRYRKRYLDLMANPYVKSAFIKRSKIIKTIRDFLDNNDFIEVETPTLQQIPGGATARPFKTYHQVLKTDLYLRVAPELYLKRLIVGGFERVYEFARCFRNEGIDWSHNPEFTMLEFYAAYWDYNDLMIFCEKLMSEIVQKVNQDNTIEFKKHKINFQPPYPKVKFREAILKETGLDIDKLKDRNELAKEAKVRGVKIDKSHGRGKILDELYKETVRPKLIQPTFLIDYPIELSPLAKRIEEDPSYVERFQLIAAGFELTNCFSELNDPRDQLERFKEQEKLRKEGDQEAQRIDYDYVEALEYGLPPTAGFGMGIDRLVALLSNANNLKEVILFPTLKPEK